MKRRWSRAILAIVIFILGLSTACADDSNLTNWLQKTLITTLSINYTSTPQDFEAIHKQNYTDNAWTALTEFLGNYRTTVRAQQLTLHPIANGPATVVRSGTVQNSNFFKGLQYWQVNQSITIPELNLSIDFSALVIKPPSLNHYLIQSLDMTIHN